MERRGPASFYSGRELEIDVFGRPKFPRGYEEVLRQESQRGYLPFNRAMDVIREYYPFDPTNPPKEFANDLRLEIIDKLGLTDEQADDLKFYSAIGTPLDTFHGVDAWLEFPDPNTSRPIFVTLDVTKQVGKLEEGHKADVIVGDVPEPASNSYLGEVERYADEVFDVFQRKLPPKRPIRPARSARAK